MKAESCDLSNRNFCGLRNTSSMNEKDRLLQWVRAATEPFGMKAKVAKALNLSNSALSHLTRGTRRLKVEEIKIIEQVTGVPRPSEHLESDDVLANRLSVSSAEPFKPEIPGGRPVFATPGSMGGGRSAGHSRVVAIGGATYSAEEIVGEIILPPVVYSSLTSASPNNIHWLPVAGDSMYPTLAAGDFVAVNVADKSIGQGGIFACHDGLTGETIVKRLRRIRNSDPVKVEIISDNANQPNEEELAEFVSVIGRVVARITRT